jgi:hypothetical protein
MKTEEDEAFDELAKRQGMWGGGFHAKRAAAADKLQDGKCKYCVDGCAACDARAQPAQEREWVGLTDEETQAYWDWEDWQTGAGRSTILEMVRDIEARLRSKNT